MSVIKKLALLILVIACVACQDQKSDKQEKFDQTMSEVLELHDSLMTEMGPINQNIKRVKAAENIASRKKEELVADLEKSHDEMMTWMKDFGEEFPNALDEKTYTKEELKEVLPAIKQQKKEMERIEDFTEKSLKNSRKTLKNK